MSEQNHRCIFGIVLCCLLVTFSGNTLQGVAADVATEVESADEVDAVKPAQLTRPVDAQEGDAEEETKLTVIKKVEQVKPVERAELTRAIDGQPANAAEDGEAVEEEAEEAMAIDIQVLPNAANNLKKFLPILEQALTIEIHYLRKVCDPTDEQLGPIREAGKKKIIELAKQFAKNEHRAFRNADKGARDLLRETILASAKQELNPQSYDRYADEMSLRNKATVEGACELMAINVDYHLSFNAEEYDQMTKLIIQNAKPQWSHNIQSMFYSEYCPLPDAKTLKPLLDTRREEIWKSKARTNSSISFGWPRNIGLQLMGNQLLFEELDEYQTESDTKNDNDTK